MTIKLSPMERDQLERAADTLEKYSRIYSELVRGETGMHIDNAGSAAGMIREIIKENEKV